MYKKQAKHRFFGLFYAHVTGTEIFYFFHLSWVLLPTHFAVVWLKSIFSLAGTIIAGKYKPPSIYPHTNIFCVQSIMTFSLQEWNQFHKIWKSPTMVHGSHSGHIHPHECDTNNVAPILCASIEVLDQHSSAMWWMEQNDLTVTVKHDYRNRLKLI